MAADALAVREAQVDAPVAVAVAPVRRRTRIGSRLATGWLTVICTSALLADVLPLRGPNQPDYERLAELPSRAHLLGTDDLGRDLLSRVVFGARVSILVGVAAVAIGLITGGLLGLLAGYFRRRTEAVITTVADALLAFPGLVLLLAITAAVGPSLRNLIVALGVLTVPSFVRLSRAYTLQHAQREYVVAARALGARQPWILFRELLPNVLPSLGAYAFLIVAVAIVAEGSLSFLGFGLAPPSVSWGGMINAGRPKLGHSPHISLVPSVAMFLTVLSLNSVGERLRARFDTKEAAL